MTGWQGEWSSCRGVAQVFEDRTLPVLVNDSVALKDNPAFVFPGWMALWLFTVLLVTNAKEVPQVCAHIRTSVSGFRRHIVPFSNNGLAPDVFGAQSVPFNLHRFLGSRYPRDFGFVD